LVDRNIILAKAGSLKRHLSRVEEKRDIDLRTFLKDIDRQESIIFNLQMAIQNCIDIAAHIVSDEGFGVPGSTSEIFYLNVAQAGRGVRRKTFIKRWDIGNMSLLQDVTESEIPEDVDKPCGILSKVSQIKLFRRTPLPAGDVFMPL